MPATLLHTADWQIGKPYASVPDGAKRARLQQVRLDRIGDIAELVASHGVDAVLVAGDLFDSPSPTKPVVSATFAALGNIPAAVIAIPGNHDFGGPGGPWEQPFVVREAEALAPNFRVLTRPEPLVLDRLSLLPAPLDDRLVTRDPTAWIRHAFDTPDAPPDDRPRVAIAHGSVHGFSSAADEDTDAAASALDLDRLPVGEIDYIALGDWHGTKEIGPRAWYAGTPEPDRFPKGEDNRPGHVLKVTVERGVPPVVEPIPTGAMRWHQLRHRFDLESGLEELAAKFASTVGDGTRGDLLLLELDGQLDLARSLELQSLLETWESRLIRLKLRHRVTAAPSGDEIERLTRRAEDPLLSRVARRLVDESRDPDDDRAATARLALRALYAATHHN